MTERFYVGMTDNAWFRFLADRQPEELNFWQPNARTFKVIEPGSPFLFKLHKPLHVIAGGGFFVRQSNLPLSLAWEAFGIKNGVESLGELRAKIGRYRRDNDPDPMIGCIVLEAPFFFQEEDWIPAPSDWANAIVQGKAYDMAEPIGAAVWEQVEHRLQAYAHSAEPRGHWISQVPAGYGPAYLAKARLGQGAFRVLVTEAYNRRCAMTGERTLPVLQAAHIKPFASLGPHQTSNGLLMRSDLHLLFDKGLLTITPDYRVEVSGRIKEQYENGRIYYALRGQPLVQLPERELERPSQEFIEWHNNHVYAG
jgi:putative restriction endonuclease